MENFTIILLGASGDLSKLKLIPAIYELLKMGKIKKFAVIGVASSERKAEDILQEAKKNIQNIDEAVWAELVKNFSYRQLNFNVLADYQAFKTYLEQMEHERGMPANRLFYCATSPEHFSVITESLAQSGLVQKGHDFQRIIYEKPFGHDLKTAQAINKSISRFLDEKNVYRADHYLGKELVANIALVRFTNRILEPLWSRRDIDSVQIILDENFGIKNRGKYYDRFGAVRDILQSHALQMLALLAMESPEKLTGDHIRMQKAAALKRTKVTDIMLGQYEGYLHESFVQPNSKTETFFAAKLAVDNKRWKGVPFFVRAGKNVDKKQTIIHIRFKAVDCLLAKSCPSDNNYLTIRIEPNEGFSFEVNSKAVEGDFEIQTIDLDYNHAQYGMHNMDAYVVLIWQALCGEQSFFICRDEIEYAWKIVDAIAMNKLSVFPYAVGSSGPKELENWNQKNHLNWKS